MSFFDDLRKQTRREANPATLALVVLTAGIFVLAWFTHADFVSKLAFAPELVKSAPWGLFTYPFATPGDGQLLIDVLFTCLWLWWIGTAVERELSTPRYVAFFLAMTVIPIILIWAMAGALHGTILIYGMLLPLSAVTVAWATRHPRENITLMFVLPIQARWVGWLAVGLVLFIYGTGAPILGAVACIHLAVCWAYAANRIPFLPWGAGRPAKSKVEKATERRDKAYFDDVRKREQERQEKEKLRQLFERSMIDDPDADR